MRDVFIVFAAATLLCGSAANAQGAPPDRFSPGEIATRSCWIDSNTGKRVPTGPFGWSPTVISPLDRYGFSNPDENHVETPKQNYAKLPDGSWIDASTGTPVPTGPFGWSPAGISPLDRYGFSNPDENHVETPKHTYVRIPCPPPTTAGTNATGSSPAPAAGLMEPVLPIAQIISATAALKARLGPCPPLEMHDDVARLRRRLRALVEAALKAGTPMDSSVTAQVTAADASLVQVDYDITQLRMKCAQASSGRAQSSTAAANASSASTGAAQASGSGLVTHGPLEPPVPVTALSNERILQIHNDERELLNIPPLHWDPVLAQHAAEYAQQIAQSGQLVHAPRAGREAERENLQEGMIGWSTDQMLQGWVSEKRYFHPGVFPNVCNGDWSRCAHYTQMIWPYTTAIGCGEVNGSGHQWLVCRYSPGGNKDGEAIEPQPRSPQRGL